MNRLGDCLYCWCNAASTAWEN